MKRQRALLVPLLAVAAVAGFGLGACGGGGDGSALATLTGPTTRAGLTASRPAAVTTSLDTTAEIETTPVETTPIEPTTPPETEPAPGVTSFEPDTTTVEPEQPAEEEPVEPAASTSDTPWGWISLGVALVAALGAGLVIWRRRQAGSAAWSRHMADLTQRCFVVLDAVLAQGSVVTGHVHALAAEAQTLEARAPDDSSKRASRPPARTARGARSCARDRSRPETRIAAAERGAALVLDGSDPPAGQ